MSRPTLLAFFTFLSVLVSSVLYLREFELLPMGPTLETADTARRIWNEGRIEAEKYHQSIPGLVELSKLPNTQHVWQDMYSIGWDGRLYPEHCLLISILAAPFFGVFGDFGFLLFNLGLALLLVGSVDRLTEALGSTYRLGILLILALGTQLLFYSYGFSYDLFGATLVVCGLDLARRTQLIGGLLVGMAVFVRPSNILYVPFLCFAWKHKRLDFAIGALFAVLLFAYLNYVMFGHPLMTSYHRLVKFVNGEMVYALTPWHTPFGPSFSFEILRSHWIEKLFDSKGGFLLYNLALFAVPFALPWAFGSKHRCFFFSVLAASIIQFLLAFSYSHWEPRSFGNRYLFPAIYLALLPLTAWISQVSERFKR